MPRIIPALALFIAGLFGPATAISQQGNPMSEDQNSVLATISQMTAAYNAGDIDAVMLTYENSATILFEPGLPVSGGDALRAMFQGSLAINPQFSFGEHEVIIQGDIALHSVTWTMTGTTPDGQDISQSGLSVAVLRRQSDGNWLMVIDNPHGQRLLDIN